MQNPLKMPSYDELVALSNGELTRRIHSVLRQLLTYEQPCKSLTEAERIYAAYKREWEKRLLVGKRIAHPYF
jgi:hypothetical protein